MVALNPWNGEEFFIIFENGISHSFLPTAYFYKVQGLLNQAIEQENKGQSLLINPQMNWQEVEQHNETSSDISKY
jgi:hypothetical protein